MALHIEDYGEKIGLYEPYEKYRDDYPSGTVMEAEISEMLILLNAPDGFYFPTPKKPYNSEECMNFLRFFLNVSMPFTICDRLIELIDHFLAHYQKYKHVESLNSLESIKNSWKCSKIKNPELLFLWKGDITLLEVDAIVNAANSQMLGCFHPLHKCIDNCIHTFAGPRLRNDCSLIMQEQGNEEPNGHAKITRAYNLPSKFVVHTVGPVFDESIQKECEQELRSCYISCLSECAKIQSINSIAFCCISTGVFLFPNDRAAEIAVATVDEWLTNNPGRFSHIVFNVFLNKDQVLYSKIFDE